VNNNKIQPTLIENVTVHDGIKISVAIYLPENLGDKKVPALFSASPYRFDNNDLPADGHYMFRENGPIDFYVEHDYAYVQMDVRGTGRSEGDFEFLGKNEQRDLYDVIEWIAKQEWCTGNVGSIGQSYFCMSQWMMGIQNPPSLKCIGAHDGMNDPYRSSVFTGGIQYDFFPVTWAAQLRMINNHPANGAEGRDITTDVHYLLTSHTLYDSFWKERTARERLNEITIPLYSTGVWEKLHSRGNLDGYRQANGPKKLYMETATPLQALLNFGKAEYHKKHYLPFYDYYLKGIQTDYINRPNVEFEVREGNKIRHATTWPPENIVYKTLFLSDKNTGSVTSLNDGSLTDTIESQDNESTSYNYPNPEWVMGVVGFGPQGPKSGFDPARRMLTFTSTQLIDDLEIAGPISLKLYISSTHESPDFFIRLEDQVAQNEEERKSGINPSFKNVSRGWLRASHRKLDKDLSTEFEPFHSHDEEQPLVNGEIYELNISLEPMAYLFKKGHRIRLDIANGSSTVFDPFGHPMRPSAHGTDTIYHSEKYPSALYLPVIQ
jgi:putative CocE/NonD family hydrolase